jgi:HK97 gp10 family phage protein
MAFFRTKLIRNGSGFRLHQRRTQQSLARELNKWARAAASLAQQLAPVRTGELRDSIAVETSSDGLVVRIVAGVDYAIFVERGTVYMAAQPFIEPAVAVIKPELIKSLKRILRQHGYQIAAA